MQRWRVADNKASENTIKNNPEVNPVVLRLLAGRGLSAEQIKKFLEPSYAQELHDPFLFKQMKEAVELIFKHLQAGNKIVVYGDYDADGICSTAIMHKTLSFLATPGKTEPAAKIDIYIPDRASEGYGLKKSAIKNLAKAGAKLIITVDNATRNVEEVEYGKSLGLDIIITDHHEPGDILPDCLIINPKVNGEQYPFLGLAGCGVAFKVAQALLTSPPTPLLKEGEGNHSSRTMSPSPYQGEGRGEVFIKWLLDLVAIGTIADLVPLIDENRVLVKYGLVVLNKTSRLGLKKLIAVARSGVDKNGNNREIDSWQVGFQLAPRLNAAGRLNHANNAYELLVTENEAEADKIAQQLNATNQERQRLTEEIFQYADTQVNQEDKILFAVDPNLTPDPSPYEGEGRNAPWPAGVMGLVAGKLTEKYYRPALAVTDKGGEIVGSGRSIAEFDVTAMLEECAEWLANFGGHKQACGFTLKSREMLAPFLAKAKKIAAEKLAGVELAPTLNIDLAVSFSDINEELYAALQQLRPFGVGNPQPKFLTANLLVVNMLNMGADGQHLKLKLQAENKILLDAVAFSASEEWKRIKVGDKIDLVYYIDRNEWNGRREMQLKIVDLKYNANTTN
ncbi:single-stranded-DNA-specific exonuclease RecJ [Candidatus Falkowbacteria bacterium CG10_big_fil_rev_8_21_14_0_10_44_15]|uniref:Single-stranded-DNA-specific exonuclease RecJ n=1 Tax=Candidatus Falkowbacteria bacterium CG10_big_fil_rev_8_21_14_0_10_44_15 TaxID=1974569 RepID=A0A2H0UZ17_9BACT|nr:MAG: single-stranded-DNA-specific exonuclease RecJ [Candidatus Falkowbacteria bacterium CG10_big_fil_rev_8_21_14_0_10_44_15]